MAGQYIEPVPPLPSLAALPGQCVVCRSWVRGRLCGACRVSFAAARPRCERCAIALDNSQPLCGGCVREPPPFARAVTAVDYEAPWSALIARFKFHAALELAPLFAQLLQGAVTEPHDRLVLPAPLSEARLRERGYNQSWELARRLARSLRQPCDARLLLRVRDTPHQIELPLDRRAANVRGAFAVEPRRRAELEGRTVALVDDVLTTGATAAEMSRVLLQAGAARVEVWVFARTPAPDRA